MTYKLVKHLFLLSLLLISFLLGVWRYLLRQRLQLIQLGTNWMDIRSYSRAACRRHFINLCTRKSPAHLTASKTL